MNIWVGLFAHLDLIVRPSPEDLLRLRGMGFSDPNREYFITEEEYKTVGSFLKVRSVEVGGNAGNMAYFLGNLGVECNLSAPVRPRSLTRLFDGLPVFVWNHRRKRMEDAARRDPEFAHIILEILPPLVNEGARMILTWDRMVREGWHDPGFFANMRDGVLIVSGFHLMRKQRVEWFVRRIREAREEGVKVYVEAGEPNESMVYAIKLLGDGADVVGMNEREASALKRFVRGDFTVHSPRWVESSVKDGIEGVITIVSAWAAGISLTEASHLQFNRSVKGVPTRRLPQMVRTKGLGDAFAVLDAIRIFYPDEFENVKEKALKFFSDPDYF